MAPDATATRSRRYGALSTGAVAVGALAYIGIGDPHRTDFGFPTCPFHALTGFYCPGCGGLRMTHDVLHGNFAAAFVDNAFALIGLPMLLAWVLIRWRAGKPWLTTPALVVFAVAIITWTVVRNVPGFPLVPTLLSG
jgi:hypothetical protein